MTGVIIDNNELRQISKQFEGLSDLKKKRELDKILVKASKPIIKLSQSAVEVNPENKTFIFNRKGAKYVIRPNTMIKSIGAIKHNKSSFAQISVGYRAKKTYDGWFAHFVDAGTKLRRNKKGAKRGELEGKNFMEKGEAGMPAAALIFEKELQRLIEKKY